MAKRMTKAIRLEKKLELKQISIEKGKGGGKIFERLSADTEDILAIGGAMVSVLLAAGIAFKTVDVVSGGAIIIAICGGAVIAKIIKAKRKKRK